ncbi:MAG: rRNA maturation RNase YbeY [Candidatus Zipacnadales bacterium]
MTINVVNIEGTPLQIEFIRQVAYVAAREAGATEGILSIALVDDQRIRELNRAHRGLDRPTDVLAYQDNDDPSYLGDVIISVGTAARQAAEAQRPLLHEVAWLAAHGVLHLLGHEDVVNGERREMIRRQDRALAAGLQAYPEASAADDQAMKAEALGEAPRLEEYGVL